MRTLTVPLPDSMSAFVEEQAAARGYRDAGEYVQALIHQAFQAHERAAIDEKLLVAQDELDRGEASEMTPADFERLRADLRRRHGMEKG